LALNESAGLGGGANDGAMLADRDMLGCGGANDGAMLGVRDIEIGRDVGFGLAAGDGDVMSRDAGAGTSDFGFAAGFGDGDGRGRAAGLGAATTGGVVVAAAASATGLVGDLIVARGTGGEATSPPSFSSPSSSTSWPSSSDVGGFGGNFRCSSCCKSCPGVLPGTASPQSGKSYVLSSAAPPADGGLLLPPPAAGFEDRETRGGGGAAAALPLAISAPAAPPVGGALKDIAMVRMFMYTGS